MQYPAHIKTLENGTEVIQSVKEHCQSTAKYAYACLESIGLGSAAKLAGLVHDLGKCTNASKTYQEAVAHGQAAKRGSVIHTFQCCRFLLDGHHTPPSEASDITRELLAFAASAHHGLYDCYDADRRSGFLHRLSAENINYNEASNGFLNSCAEQSLLNDSFQSADVALTNVYYKLEQMSVQNNDQYGTEFSFYLGLLARMLLSAVIEGDRRDTTEFFHGTVFSDRPEDMRQLWKKRLEYAETKIRGLPCETLIQHARRDISDMCRAAAEKGSGIYRLNVPTGAGKTLSSLRFALKHAAKNNKRRIIFTAPLLSILEQNAAVLRHYLGDDSLVLEHHSNIISEAERYEQLDHRELLQENWNAPVIITTMVQLLNTMFDGRTTSIRRFWALCDSIIVIDEVQTVPNQMLTLFNLTINFLSEICGATVVLCSATQPCLEHTDHSLLRKPEEIVPYDEKLWKSFARTRIVRAKDRTMEEIPEFILKVLDDTESLLVVCNKKSEAEYLFKQVSAQHPCCFHLSAAMCMAHRRKVLSEINTTLERRRNGGLKPICIATQVIEAGVDISFGCVIRLTAGIDSVIQAAGRCNRNGEVIGQAPVPVYVLTCLNEQLGMLQEIQNAKDATQELLTAYSRSPERFDNDLSSDKAVSFYYHKLYQQMAEGYQDYTVPKHPSLFSMLSDNAGYANPDSEGYETYCLKQAFRTAGTLFNVFNEDTETVVVPYGEGVALIDELVSKGENAEFSFLKDWLQRAKPYTISVYDYQKRRLEKDGLYYVSGVAILQSHNYDKEGVGLVLKANENTFLEV